MTSAVVIDVGECRDGEVADAVVIGLAQGLGDAEVADAVIGVLRKRRAGAEGCRRAEQRPEEVGRGLR